MNNLFPYGVPNADWLRFVNANSLPSLPPHQNILDLQDRINAEREATASQQLSASGWFHILLSASARCCWQRLNTYQA